jgi:1-acyl-sn-glycerol-3-phosphate acyltransferase
MSMTENSKPQPLDHLPTPLKLPGSVMARGLMRLFGWRVSFDGLPGPKGVIIAYPHTSNWDFVVGILTKWATGIPLSFWAKEGLFKGVSAYTLGPLMRYWGGVPVERSKSSGVIAQTVQIMQEREFFWLALAPEGTRSYRDHWKSGFYQVALQAQVPLGLAYFDYANKVVGVTQFMMLTGDESADLARIASAYEGIIGRRQALAAPIVFKSS